MIRLTARMLLAGGREPLVRLAVTAVGVAIGVTLLLLAAVSFPALHAHDVRAGWVDTSAHNSHPAQDETRTDPLLWDAFGDDDFDGKQITRVEVAALGPRAPLPPGLTRIPGPGEIAVSPALARLMARTPHDMLADRFPGRVVATVGAAALIGPEQLVAFVGYDPAVLRAPNRAEQVRSIEGAAVSHSAGSFLKVMIVIGVLGLILPVIVFIGTATRLAAARREQRLAALRLVGATTTQAAVLAMLEAAIAAVTGVLLGFGVFAVARPYVARIPFDGYSFFTSDLHLAPLMAAIVALGVPALAVVVAMVSLRRVQLSPLGVTRQAPRGRPTWRRLVPLAVGLAAFGVALPFAVTAKSNTDLVAMAGAFVIVVAGLVVAGPWLTIAVARVMGRFGRSPSTLLATRRLQDNPAAGFRSISGLILAVFIASLVSGVAPSAESTSYGKGGVRLPAGAVSGVFVYRNSDKGIADPGLVASLDRRLHATAGVAASVIMHALPAGVRAAGTAHGTASAFPPIIARCADLRATGLATCTDPAATVAMPDPREGTTSNVARPLMRPVPTATLRRLPVVAVVATTDGRPASIERTRTAMWVAAAALNPSIATTADLVAAQRHNLLTLQRLTTVALLLTLVIAGCGLAVSVVAGLLERKRPFALLRLAGMRPGELYRVVLAETSAPLLAVAAISAGLGLALATMVLRAVHAPWKPPHAIYWVALSSGLVVALLIASAAALALLNRLTSLEAARFE